MLLVVPENRKTKQAFLPTFWDTWTLDAPKANDGDLYFEKWIQIQYIGLRIFSLIFYIF